MQIKNQTIMQQKETVIKTRNSQVSKGRIYDR